MEQCICIIRGWEPLSADQGFKAGDNVVTLNSCTSTDSIFSVGADEHQSAVPTLDDQA